MEPTRILSLDEIEQSQDLASKVVDVPEWGGAVRLQEFDAASRDLFDLETLERERLRKTGAEIPPHLANVRARLVGRCLVDADGARLCRTAEDFDRLARKNGDVVDRLFDVCRELCGLTRAEVKETGKDSEPDPSA